MKKLLLLMVLSTILNGCAIPQNIAANCGGDLVVLCEDIFGTDSKKISHHDDDIANLKQKIKDIELSIAVNKVTVNSLVSSINSLQLQETNNGALLASLQANILSAQSMITVLQTNSSANSALIIALQASIASMQASITTLSSTTTTQVTVLQTNLTTIETNIANNTTQLAVLNGYQHITGMVNPCGDNPSKYDEVFIKIYSPSTNSYQLIASFSDNANGDNTRFSVLPVGGPYSTTDGDGCQFSVAADGFTIINENHHF